MRDYQELAKKIKVSCHDEASFCTAALEWLAGQCDNLHVEYTDQHGWRINCFPKGSMTGETLFIAVCRTVENEVPMEFAVGNKYRHKKISVTVVCTGKDSGVVIDGRDYPIGTYSVDWTFSRLSDFWEQVK